MGHQIKEYYGTCKFKNQPFFLLCFVNGFALFSNIKSFTIKWEYDYVNL